MTITGTDKTFDFTGKPVILRREVEIIGAKRIKVIGLRVNAGHKVANAICLQDCEDVELVDCQGANAVTLDPDEAVGHNLLVNRCKGVRIIRFYSIFEPKKGMKRPRYLEDGLNVNASADVVIENYTHTGPANNAGTGLCLDHGSAGVVVTGGAIRMQGSKTGLTICCKTASVSGLSIRGTTDACVRVRSVEYYGTKVDRIELNELQLQPAAGLKIDIEPENQSNVHVR